MPYETIKKITDQHAAEHLVKYFALRSNGRPRYTGSRFETFMVDGGVDEANKITSNDLVAVSMLSVHIGGEAALGLVEDLAGEASKLLEEIPVGLKFEELDDDGHELHFGRDSAALKLWNLLRQNGGDRWGIGPTTASKIMARKRPHLVPIYDSVVAEITGMTSKTNQWDMWRAAFNAEDSPGSKLQDRLETIRELGGQPHLSLLRVLDIVLWMEGLGSAKLPEADEAPEQSAAMAWATRESSL